MLYALGNDINARRCQCHSSYISTRLFISLIVNWWPFELRSVRNKIYMQKHACLYVVNTATGLKLHASGYSSITTQIEVSSLILSDLIGTRKNNYMAISLLLLL